MWPELLRQPGFLKEFVTPIIKTSNKRESHSFFTIPEYEKWALQNKDELKNTKIKYYKGLGTSTGQEAKEYFKAIDKHRIKFKYQQKEDDDAIDLAFNKKKADDRKIWLSNYNPQIFVDHNIKELRYNDFVYKELIHFSVADNLRSIPSLIDGFKPGQRKIIYACFKRKLK
jgi:DNA topoisomerase II